MVKVFFSKHFKKVFQKISEKDTREHILTRIQKISEYPYIGKPMKHDRKGTREVYIGSYRLSYRIDKITNAVVLLDFYHKDQQ